MSELLSDTRIRLSGSARRELLSIVERTTGVDGRESGGVLFGGVNHRLLEVVEVSGPGPGAKRERDSYRADADHDLQLIDEVVERSGGALVEVGRWHVHPSGYRAPSPADLQAFVGMRTLVGDRSVELIVVPTCSGTWDLEGFIVSGSGWQLGGDGRARCERARLVSPL